MPDDKENIVAQYLRTISQFKLFKPEEELEKAKELDYELYPQLNHSLCEYKVKPGKLNLSKDQLFPGLCLIREKIKETSANNYHEYLLIEKEVRKDRKGSKTKSKKIGLVNSYDSICDLLSDSDGDWKKFLRVTAESLLFDVRKPEDEIVYSPDEIHYYADLRRSSKIVTLRRNEYVQANLRLVVSIANRFPRKSNPFIDLIQEGNVGLMKAIDRFDYRRGYRFSTYATWWIRHAISRSLADTGRNVRIPVHAMDGSRKITKFRRETLMKTGILPTEEETATACGVNIEFIRKYGNISSELSLDRKISEEDGRTYAELLPAGEECDLTTEGKLILEHNLEYMRYFLGNGDLKPIESEVLEKRNGLNGYEEMTLNEIGEEYSLSRERIRQIQKKAVSKIRRAMQREGIISS